MKRLPQVFRHLVVAIEKHTDHCFQGIRMKYSKHRRYLRYSMTICLILLIILFIQKQFTSSRYVYNPSIHSNVPSDLRLTVRGSAANYTIDDLKRMTAFHSPPANPSIHSIFVLTQWYHETDLRRRNELLSVLHMNVINPAITEIHFIQNSNHCTIYEDIPVDSQFPLDLLRKKLRIFYETKPRYQNKRLIIRQAFQYANNYLTSGYCILVNLDIFFDRSLLVLTSRSLLDRRTILYLSRYEIDPTITTLGPQCSPDSYVGSHDALIFQAPIEDHLIEKFPFEVGTWHAEAKIIYEFLQANYLVRNACKTLRIWHLHSSQIRHRLMPSEKYIPDDLLPEVLRYPEYL